MPPYHIRDRLPRQLASMKRPQHQLEHEEEAGEGRKMSAAPPSLADAVPKPSASLPVQSTTGVVPTSPIRPRHLTTRSITEISPPSQSKLHSRHHHKHPHIHKHRTSDIHIDTEGVTRSEGVTPAESRNASRRGSMFGGHGLEGTGEVIRAPKENEVREEREKVVLRATELRNALLELNAQSNNTTRRLDNTYYSVLEKLSILQNTISSMQELASMTRQLKDEFAQEANDIVADVTSQTDGFEGFEEQQKRISALAERVQTGREKIKMLGGQADVVKRRVDGWEAAEAEWKDKTRKRLKMMWIIMAVVGGVFVAVLLFQQYLPAKVMVPEVKALNTSGLLGRRPDIEMIGNETKSTKHVGKLLEGLRNNERREEDSRLRVFDEL